MSSLLLTDTLWSLERAGKHTAMVEIRHEGSGERRTWGWWCRRCNEGLDVYITMTGAERDAVIHCLTDGGC